MSFLNKFGSWLDDDRAQYLLSMLRDRRGVTVIEYGMIAALITIAVIVVLNTIGTTVSQLFFQQIATNL